MAKYIHVPSYGCLTNTQVVPVKNQTNCIEKLWAIGGENGWYYLDVVWRIRGVIDKFFGGVGLRRGRTNKKIIFTPAIP